MLGNRMDCPASEGFDMIKQNENAMIDRNTDAAMPEQILRQVKQVRRSSQSRDRRYAWLVAASVLAIAMIVAMMIEAQLNLFSHALRFALTTFSLVAAAVCGWTLWQRGKQNNERLVSAAKEVDATFPTLEERVSTLTSCEEDRLASKRTAHPAMLNRLASETTKIHQRVETKPIVSQNILRRPLMWLAAAAAIMLGMFVWDAPKTMVQFGRFWAPWANLSVTRVSPVEADYVVARHEPLKLTASLKGRLVDEVEFVSTTVEGSERSHTQLWPSAKDPSVARLRKSKAIESFDYQFRAGDGQTAWHRVTVADRPKIQDMTMRIVPPAYTGKPAKIYKKLPKKTRVVAGSRLEMSVTTKTDVRTARLVMGKTDWLPMEPGGEGAYEGSMELRQPVNFEVQLTELHGLVNRRPPRCSLQVVGDQAPKVKIVRPTKTAVLLPDEVIDIHFKASDDHGIKEMALRVYTQREGEETPTVHEVPIPISDEKNNRKIKGSVALDLAQFDLQDGDTIRYEVRASDNFKPLENLFDQSEFQPMEGVELVQNAEVAESPDNVKQPNGADVKSAAAVKMPAGESSKQESSKQEKVSTAASDTQVAQSSSAKDANAATPKDSGDSAAKNAQAQNAQSKSAESQSAQAEASQAQPSNAKRSSENQVASRSSSNSPSTNGDKSPKDDRPSDDARAEKPSTDKMAEASPKNDPASNENKIQEKPAEDGKQAKAPDPAAVAKSDPANKSESPNGKTPAAKQSSQAKSSSQSQSGNSGSSSPPKMAANDANKPDSMKTKAEKSGNQKDQDPNSPKSDPVQMAKRSLDVGGQSSSSGQQQIKVDRYAGGFTSEHRHKLEIAIAPTLELLKESLKNAGTDVRRVMNPTNQDPTTGAAADTALMHAASELNVASEAVIQLNQKTRNTPYAFVGLRLESIRTADVSPAWDDVRKAIEADGEPRIKHSSTAWNHINRALATLAKLEEKYEQVKRALKKADDIQKFKKMHRVFIENSMAMLNPKNSQLNGQNRKIAEFDLDEEYLKRLKEVLQMRQDMMAELARILADDPQLLRRYMNRMNNRTSTIRDQLTLIARDQQSLSLRVESWANASKQPPDLVEHVVGETEVHLSEIQELANRVADLQDEFVSWLPLEDDVKKGEAAETLANFKEAGSGLTEVVADVEVIFSNGGVSRDVGRQVEPLLSKATEADKQLGEVNRSLQRMANNEGNSDLANNALRRLPRLQTLRKDLQQWAGKLELLAEDQIHEIYSVDQEDRRGQLLEYAVKIASLDSQLAAALQNEDGQLPADVATMSEVLQQLLDVEIPADQLTAAQTLSDADATQAKSQQKRIVVKFERAEQLFDEILQTIADELDKLPVDDPIASLLRDPTLDEILFQLENELDSIEELGLSLRRSNLQIMGDWSRSSMLRQLMGQQQRMRNLSNKAYRNALARARVKNGSKKRKPKLAKDGRRWNLLVSQLEEDMLQGDKKVPPERYRSAIDQYFEKISKLKNAQDSE